MDEIDWKRLLTRIESGLCTPFLGAGACHGTLPLGSQIAREWAEEQHYPLDDADDLARVAQFVGVRNDAMWPKERMQERLRGLGPPDFSGLQEPHAALAALPLPIYMTTNYDDFMLRALQHARRDPVSDICRWNSYLRRRDADDVFTARPDYVPTPASPLVYHLHGQLEDVESLVLTEDDYLDFLVATAREDDVIPLRIQEALAGSSLLFIGYRLADWNFRVLHRGLVMAGEHSLRRLSVTVQIPGSLQAQSYLDKYFSAMNVQVYWGTSATFTQELRDRWTARNSDG